jgi:hypothetical protein
MYKNFKSIVLASIATLGSMTFAAPAHAIPTGWVLNSVTCNSGNSFQWIGPPSSGGGDFCPDGVDPALSNTSPVGTRPLVLFSAVNLAVKSTDVIDLNAVTGGISSEALGMDAATVAAIRDARTVGAFANAEDFALRVCSKNSVTLRASAIRVGATEYRATPVRDPRGLSARRPAPVFSCVAGSGTYEVVGRPHNYVGHVTLLR